MRKALTEPVGFGGGFVVGLGVCVGVGLGDGLRVGVAVFVGEGAGIEE